MPCQARLRLGGCGLGLLAALLLWLGLCGGWSGVRRKKSLILVSDDWMLLLGKQKQPRRGLKSPRTHIAAARPNAAVHTSMTTGCCWPFWIRSMSTHLNTEGTQSIWGLPVPFPSLRRLSLVASTWQQRTRRTQRCDGVGQWDNVTQAAPSRRSQLISSRSPHRMHHGLPTPTTTGRRFVRAREATTPPQQKRGGH